MSRVRTVTNDRAGTPPLRTERTRLRRQPDRGSHEQAAVESILDAGLVCHLAFAVDGHPWAIPMAYGRVGETLYLHGAAGNHALRALSDGAEACATVTIVDGLVLARSGFHHSINYRCAMVFGRAERVLDDAEQRGGLDAIVDHALPGRSDEVRRPTPKELRATRVVRLPIREASAKQRAGGPVDDAEDLGLDVWAGHVPLTLTAAAPAPAPNLASRTVVPQSLRRWHPSSG